MSEARPRVLWLTKGLGRGGAEMLLLALARTIDASAVRLEVAYVLPHKDALVADLRAAGVEVTCLGDGRPGSWVRPLRRLLATGDYDVVHTHAPVVASAARLLAPGGTRLAHTEHNVWSRYRRPTRWANRLTLHRNVVVWAVSQGVLDSIRPWRRRDDLRVEVMLHGISPHSIGSGPQVRAEARRRLGLPDDALVVGTVGNLTPKKDHDMMVRAFAAVVRERPDARLVVIGTGPRHQHLVDVVRRAGLEDRVLLTGIRDDVPELLAGFDVFAMSSLYEGLSIALVEALAAGLPVVATRVGGIPELVTDGTHGFLVEAGDDRAMARRILQVTGDPDLYADLSAAATARADDFGIQPAAEELTRSYLALASTRPRTAVPS